MKAYDMLLFLAFSFVLQLGFGEEAISKNYLYYPAKASYVEAQCMCSKMEPRQNLARFDSLAEYKKVVKYLNTCEVDEDIYIDPNGKWTDGFNADMTSFTDEMQHKHCAVIRHNGRCWNVKNTLCHKRKYFLCYHNVSHGSVSLIALDRRHHVFCNLSSTRSPPDMTTLEQQATTKANTDEVSQRPIPSSAAFNELCMLSPYLCRENHSTILTVKAETDEATNKPIFGSEYASVPNLEITENTDVVFTTINPEEFNPYTFLSPLEEFTDLWSGLGIAITVPLLTYVTINTGSSVPVNYTIKVADGNIDLSRVQGTSTQGVSVIRGARAECVFVNETSNRFSTFGIETLNPHTKDFICVSNHSTIFAALLIVDVVVIPHAVKTTSYVLEGASMFSLLLAFIVLVIVRRALRSSRTVVQINLCVALFFLHLFNVINDAALKAKAACEMTAISIHYFLLCSAMWMLLEGVTLVKKILSNSLQVADTKKERNIKLAVGWILPAVVVTAFALIGFLTGTYMDSNPALLDGLSDVNPYSQCWIKKNSWLLAAGVIFPLAVVLLANLLITIRVGMFVYEMSRKADDLKPTADRVGTDSNRLQANLVHTKASLRAVLMLLPVLGIPWLFMFIQVNHPALMYLNVILNGLQGFFILIIYCVLSKDVRTAVMESWKRSNLLESLTSTFK